MARWRAMGNLCGSPQARGYNFTPVGAWSHFKNCCRELRGARILASGPRFGPLGSLPSQCPHCGQQVRIIYLCSLFPYLPYYARF